MVSTLLISIMNIQVVTKHIFETDSLFIFVMEGAFIFVHDNDTAVVYTVVSDRVYYDPSGQCANLNDLLDLSKRSLLDLDPYPVFSNMSLMRPDFEVLTTTLQQNSQRNNQRNRYRNRGSLNSSINSLDFLSNSSLFSYEKRRMSLAQKIETIIEDNEEMAFLRQKDEYGWTPLHQACCFHSKDEDLISILIGEYPQGLLTEDHCGRMPLHIAANSNSSCAVINLLLEKDKDNIALHKASKHLKVSHTQ